MSIVPRSLPRIETSLIVQLALVLSMIGVIAVAPPAHGRYLLIPLTHNGARDVAGLAISRDARLLGTGRIRNSLIVEGDRSRLAGPMLRAGILPLAGYLALCGEIVAGGVPARE